METKKIRAYIVVGINGCFAYCLATKGKPKTSSIILSGVEHTKIPFQRKTETKCVAISAIQQLSLETIGQFPTTTFLVATKGFSEIRKCAKLRKITINKCDAQNPYILFCNKLLSEQETQEAKQQPNTSLVVYVDASVRKGRSGYGYQIEERTDKRRGLYFPERHFSVIKSTTLRQLKPFAVHLVFWCILGKISNSLCCKLLSSEAERLDIIAPFTAGIIVR